MGYARPIRTGAEAANTPEPKNSPQCKRPYWNKPRPALARGDPAWLKDGAQKVA